MERGAGLGSGFPDEDYAAAGATLVSREDDVVGARADREGEGAERRTRSARLRRGQVLFTYLHLAANAADCAKALLDAGVIGIAYETIQHPDGTFPVLAPMSEVAGRLAVQIGVSLLQKDRGGKGLLLGGVPGVMRGRVCVIGGGIVGINAVRVAHALGAEVDVLDIDLRRLTYLYDIFHGELNTLFSNQRRNDRALGADERPGDRRRLRHGRRAPILVTDAMVARMEPGSVIVDVAVDQGGCVETIHPTTHADPTYELHGVIHYGVANMPGAVPRTSTLGAHQHDTRSRAHRGAGRRGGRAGRQAARGRRQRLARQAGAPRRGRVAVAAVSPLPL